MGSVLRETYVFFPAPFPLSLIFGFIFYHFFVVLHPHFTVTSLHDHVSNRVLIKGTNHVGTCSNHVRIINLWDASKKGKLYLLNEFKQQNKSIYLI